MKQALGMLAEAWKGREDGVGPDVEGLPALCHLKEVRVYFKGSGGVSGLR